MNRSYWKRSAELVSALIAAITVVIGCHAAPVAPTVGPGDGHVKALSVAFPYGAQSVPILAVANYDLITVQFSAMFTTSAQPGPNASQKLIVYVNDASGKIVAQIWHDGNGQWGVRPGSGYSQSTLPNATNPWTKVEVILDQKAKKYSLKLTNGQTAVVLFDSVDYTDAAAGPPASIVFQRNGQGDPGLCYIDDISVGKGAVKMPDRLNAWVETAPRLNIVPSGKNVVLRVEADRATCASADQLDWSVADYLGHVVKTGALPVPSGTGKWATLLSLGALPAGYYALSGNFRTQGLDFSRCGSEPENVIAFGVLPALAALPLAHTDDSRFGAQGTNFIKSGKWMAGDPYDPLYPALGARWVNSSESWDQLEPDHAGQYMPKPTIGGEFAYAANHGMTYLTTTHGIPAWAMAVPPTDRTAALGGKIDSQAYPPQNAAQFEDFTTRFAHHMDQVRRAYFPTMAHNWYQISWEPDWHWKGTPRQYVDMASHAYTALHRGDPAARIMGPGTGVFDKTVEWLHTMLPLGLGKSLDGIATHAYYLGEGDPNHPPLPGQIFAPEDQKVIQDMREVKSLARRYLKPGARIIQSEWGLDYKGSYAIVNPAILRQLAAYMVRGHIILLGEGADTTYFFYTSDYAGESGFGLTFNLTMPDPNFGAIRVAPKPEFMACAAMTRVLEGTKTIGPLTGLPADCYGYAFDRAGKTVVAVWKAHPGASKISLPLAKGTSAQLIDFMGNPAAIESKGGRVTVAATEYPGYIEGVDASKLTIKVR